MDYILFDLEATCWPKGTPGVRQEVIEIGAVKMNQGGKVLREFHCMVKPVLHPFLSPFCLELTGITQDEVDRGRRFPNAMTDFENWVHESDDFLMLSWGYMDLNYLQTGCAIHRVEHDWIASSYHDLKALYRDICRLPGKIGLKAAMRREGIIFEGDAHRALPDAQNLALLFRRHIDMWPVH